MKTMIFVVMLLGACVPAYGQDALLEKYISEFRFDSGKEMKIDSKTLVELLKEGKAQLVDIRFPEEYEAWKVGPSINIPLNELPKRWSEIDKTKLTVTVCPHSDRSNVAMVYLRSKGIKAKFVSDGLLGIAENLRGESARELVNAIK
jgi:rhodanese-related sulfurtransferase